MSVETLFKAISTSKEKREKSVFCRLRPSPSGLTGAGLEGDVPLPTAPPLLHPTLPVRFRA